MSIAQRMHMINKEIYDRQDNRNDKNVEFNLKRQPFCLFIFVTLVVLKILIEINALQIITTCNHFYYYRYYLG